MININVKKKKMMLRINKGDSRWNTPPNEFKTNGIRYFLAATDSVHK